MGRHRKFRCGEKAHHSGGVSARLTNQTHYWRKLKWKGHQSHICSTTHASQPLRACDTRFKATVDGQRKKKGEGDVELSRQGSYHAIFVVITVRFDQ